MCDFGRPGLSLMRQSCKVRQLTIFKYSAACLSVKQSFGNLDLTGIDVLHGVQYSTAVYKLQWGNTMVITLNRTHLYALLFGCALGGLSVGAVWTATELAENDQWRKELLALAVCDDKGFVNVLFPDRSEYTCTPTQNVPVELKRKPKPKPKREVPIERDKTEGGKDSGTGRPVHPLQERLQSR